MRITGLKPAGRRPGFVSIDAGGVRMGVLPVEEIRALGVAVGQELDGKGEERLLTALERVKAYDAAVRLLAVRGRAVQEIVTRLRRKGLRPDAVDHAVGRLESEALLDHAAMAREYARSRVDQGYGRARILADLSRRGVARREAERAVAEVGGDDEGERRSAMLALARKRAAQLRGLDRDVAKRRLLGYMARRGYAGGEVWGVVDEALGPDVREQEVGLSVWVADGGLSPYWHRRLGRHGLLGAVGLGVPALGVVGLASKDVIWKVSVTSGWVGVVLLAVTLVLGPLNVLRGRPNPVSFDLGRDVGIWAAVLGVAHTVAGLFVHFRGRPWVQFLWPAEVPRTIPIRYDLFGAASWSGLAAMLLVVALAAVSNDLSLRRLGPRRWKALQRTNYVLFGLVALHGLLFQVAEKRTMGLVVLLGATVGITAVVQLWGVQRARRGRRPGRD